MNEQAVTSTLAGSVGRAQPRFLYWEREGTWSALVAARLPTHVRRNSLDQANWGQEHDFDRPVCVLLAADAAAPEVLFDCVRHFSERSGSLILVIQRSASAALTVLLSEAGAHAVLGSIADLIRWVPAIRRWLQ